MPELYAPAKIRVFILGQEVLLTGWGVGENHWGGLAEQARVKGDWLVAMPQGLDARKAMIIGTAVFYRHAVCDGAGRCLFARRTGRLS